MLNGKCNTVSYYSVGNRVVFMDIFVLFNNLIPIVDYRLFLEMSSRIHDFRPTNKEKNRTYTLKSNRCHLVAVEPRRPCVQHLKRSAISITGAAMSFAVKSNNVSRYFFPKSPGQLN